MFYIDSDPYGICHAGFFVFMRVCGLLSRRATEGFLWSNDSDTLIVQATGRKAKALRARTGLYF